MLTNRISYFFNWSGPSEPVDTACSSSLVAIHRAVESIWHEGCPHAVAGGINLIASPNLFIAGSSLGMLSKDGKCKTFDKDADGYVRGEGAGALLLKPLSAALRDKDYIHGVIRGRRSIMAGSRIPLLPRMPNPRRKSLSAHMRGQA